jgi:carbon storage regulator
LEAEETGMLVLDRKLQEGFWIEGRIFVKVLSVGRRRVKLGIEAPADSKIMREELKNGVAEHVDQLAERSTR